ncbi:MAG: hypothetical protein V2I38_13980 [Alcanivoracaceae bacterium]|jgi:YD repeat-containing protein|nr:hypothetical protein [Alcanivoracaceae bacterium]
MTTGCGGGSSSAGNAASRTINSAPSQAFFHDEDGALVSRMNFQYPDELTINVQLQAAGEDMILDTEDDTSHPYLQCLYMSAPTPLLRYPDVYFLGMSRSATGSLGLAMHGIPNSGLIRCPVRSGRRLQQESGYVSSLFTPAQGDSYSYLINAELEHLGGTATEVLDYEFFGLDTTVAEVLELAEFEVFGVDLATVDEPDLPIIDDHRQITTVIYDAEQRPLSIDLIAESSWTAVLDECCMDSEPLVISIKLLRGCSSAREIRSYRYMDNGVEQVAQRYSGSNPADIYTSTATRLANSVIVYPGTVDDDPTSGTRYRSYPLNESEQVTAEVSHFYGVDRLWGTEDDQNEALDTYHYDENGRLSEVRYRTWKQLAYDYYPNGQLKQVDEPDEQSDIPWRRTLISYRHGSPARVTVQWRAEDPDDGYVLKTRMVIDFAPSEETWSALFLPVVQLPEMPPSVNDLMQFQPIR